MMESKEKEYICILHNTMLSLNLPVHKSLVHLGQHHLVPLQLVQELHARNQQRMVPQEVQLQIILQLKLSPSPKQKKELTIQNTLKHSNIWHTSTTYMYMYMYMYVQVHSLLCKVNKMTTVMYIHLAYMYMYLFKPLTILFISESIGNHTSTLMTP